MKLIGISGTNGSGKDTLGKILADDYGWCFISVTDILRHELIRRDIEITRKNLRHLSAEWRRQSGLGVLIDEATQQFGPQKNDFKGLAIASLRNHGEADRLHELGGKVVWVDADPKVRYERIVSRGRKVEDARTYEQFLQDQEEEMEHYKGDKATLDLRGVKERADIFIINDSNDSAVFKAKIEKALGIA